MPVRLLPDTVIDQIAAGEVVERPAAVVKELVENSLDAGARTVRVYLDSGGNDLVRITDDGVGMDRHDALMCLERHATSKIQAIEDLIAVRSFGFRGEAIPSIASVSRFELLTRRHDDAVGTRIVVEGGDVVSVRDAGCAPGTEIKVRDLFYNVPVRRGFLRTAATELGHCTEAVVREALLRPQVDVAVLHNGREHLRLAAVEDRAARAAAVLGKEAARLRVVQAQDLGVEVEGLVSPPSLHDGSSSKVYLFVNGRYVRDPVLRKGVREAYQGLLPAGRHPILVLEVRLPGDRVDVNVHPSKIEVRFRDPRDVAHVIASAIREALRRPEPHRREAASGFDRRGRPPSGTLPIPGLAAHPSDDPTFVERPAPPPVADPGGGEVTASRAVPGAGIAAESAVADYPRGVATAEVVDHTERDPTSGGSAAGRAQSGPGHVGGRGGEGGGAPGGAGGAPSAATANSIRGSRAEGRSSHGELSGSGRTPSEVAASSTDAGASADVSAVGADASRGAGGAVAVEPHFEATGRVEPARPQHVGELPALTPLSPDLAVSVVGDGVVVIDLGELRAEVVRRALVEGGSPQRLLLPVVETVGRAVADRLLAHAEVLEGVGLSIAGFGPGQVALKRVPEPLVGAAWAAVLPALSDALGAAAPREGGPGALADGSGGLARAVLDLLARAAPPTAASPEALAALCAAAADAPIAPPLGQIVGADLLRRAIR